MIRLRFRGGPGLNWKLDEKNRAMPQFGAIAGTSPHLNIRIPIVIASAMIAPSAASGGGFNVLFNRRNTQMMNASSHSGLEPGGMLVRASFYFRPPHQYFKTVHQVDAWPNTRRTALSRTKCTRQPNLLFRSEKVEWHNGCIESL